MKITQKKQKRIAFAVIIKRITMLAMLLALSTSMMYAQKKSNAKTKKVVKTDSTKGFETLLWGDTVEQVKEKGYDIEHIAVENKAKNGFSDESEMYRFNNQNYRGEMLFLNEKLYLVVLEPANGDTFSIPDLQKQFGEYPYYENKKIYTDAKTEGRSSPDFKNISSLSISYNSELVFLCDWQYSKEHFDIGREFSGKKTFEEMEKEKALAAEKAKKNAELEAKAKEITKGLVYHGRDEAERNAKLFAGGALEEGHAYYVPGFIVKYGGTLAAIEYGDGLLFSSQSSSVYVDYIDQKVKGEIIEAGSISFFGQTLEIPLTVVIVGGKAPLHTPVVIGLLK